MVNLYCLDLCVVVYFMIYYCLVVIDTTVVGCSLTISEQVEVP